MGAWGFGPFDTDASGDLLDELAVAADVPAALRQILSRVADASGRVDGWEADQAAAAAVLVAVRSAGVETVPEEAAEFLAGRSFECTDDLRALTIRTFERLLDPADNEWRDLWVKSHAFHQVVAELEPFRRAVGQV